MDVAALIGSLSSPETLAKINEEIQPERVGRKRRQSGTVLRAVRINFGVATLGRGRTDGTALRAIVIAHLRQLDEVALQQLQQLVLAMYGRPPYHMVAQWYVSVNQAARDEFGEDAAETKLIAKYMRTPKEAKRLSMLAAQKQVIGRNRQQLSVDYKHALEVVRQWMSSGDWKQNFLAVQASIGCRKTELLDPRITFYPSERGPDWIVQVGVLKDYSVRVDEVYEDDGEEVVSASGRAVEKPIVFGFTYSEIATAIDKVREETKDLVESKTRKGMGQVHSLRTLMVHIKHAFAREAKQRELNTHFLRTLYANVAHHFFSDAIKGSITSFISSVLAHNENSLATALSYQTVRVDGLPRKRKRD